MDIIFGFVYFFVNFSDIVVNDFVFGFFLCGVDFNVYGIIYIDFV